jgi:hypothetical protein
LPMLRGGGGKFSQLHLKQNNLSFKIRDNKFNQT